jgi:integrase
VKKSGVVRVWSKESGLGPDGVGLRGFKPHTPHFGQDLLELRGNIVETLLWMKRQGYPESSISVVGRRLRSLLKGCNLKDPKDVKRHIAEKSVSNGYKDNLVKAYDYYAKTHGIRWIKPRYKRERRLPKVPTTEAIEKIIARSSWRFATIFRVLKDTGMMPEELHRTTLRDIDLERGLINSPACKGHNPRVLKVKPSTLAMLKRWLSEDPKERPFPKSERISDAWRRYRNDLSKKLHDPTLRTIRLYDLRHYFGTMTYHRTKDILYTKQQMGHRKIETTLIYTHLINFESDEWVCRVAKTVGEATQLIESGFEYVTEIDNAKLFRKPR